MTIHSETGSFDLSALNNLNQNLTQYFWFEEGGEGSYPWGLGAHVTLYPQDDFTNPNDSNYLKGQNILINTDGFSLRNGTVPLMVLDNDSLDFNLITDLSQGTYVGVATFGTTGAQIGASGSGHTTIQTSGMQIYGSDGTVELANIGYGRGNTGQGGTAYSPYYTLGKRKTSSEIGNYSMAEGYNTTASGPESHAEGYDTTASGVYSHAEGDYTFALGNFSHAEGDATEARGSCSHAEGSETKAIHFCSHASGHHTQTSGLCQTVMGSYNDDDSSALLIIGNGTKDNARSNALTVSSTGDVNIASGAKYKINGTALSASDVDAVPTTRKVNNHALSSDITLTASDVGALATSGGDITGNLSYKSSTIDASLANNGVSSTQYPTTFNILDKSNRILTRKEAVIESGGNISAYWYVRNYNTSGTQVGQKGIKITMDKSGNVTYGVDDSSKFLSALSMNKYTRSSAGHLDWTNSTDGDSHAIMKSALAFWNGRYNATTSNLAYCNKGAFGTLATKNSLSASEVGAVARSVCCYANSRVDTFSNGQVSVPLANFGITNKAKPVGVLMTYQDGGATPTILQYDYDASNSTNVIIRAYNSSGAAVNGAIRYFAMVFQGSWTTP